jgi:imidazolonepropionase-like amidohydrolase
MHLKKAIIFFLSSLSFMDPQLLGQTATYVFRNANVITMTSDEILQGKTVLVKDGKISMIAREVRVPENARVIDAAGGYLIPGLFDMHMHFYHDHGLNKNISTRRSNFHWPTA